MFLKGHLYFTVDQHALEFIHQPISPWGVGGLPWSPLDPELYNGKIVTLTLKIPSLGPKNIITPAMILRERTATTDSMCIKFMLDTHHLSLLRSEIQKYGSIPSNYARKYPRIPLNDWISTFPKTVRIKSTFFSGTVPDGQLDFQVLNLSPNGALVSSSHAAARFLKPGTRVELSFPPYGHFPATVEVGGMVRRTMDEFSSEPGNSTIIRHLGIQFTRISEVDKAVFLELLKEILTQIKKSFRPSQ